MENLPQFSSKYSILVQNWWVTRNIPPLSVTSLTVISLITFDDFRDPPTQCLHFPSKFERFPLCLDPSNVFSDLPFWVLNYD